MRPLQNADPTGRSCARRAVPLALTLLLASGSAPAWAQAGSGATARAAGPAGTVQSFPSPGDATAAPGAQISFRGSAPLDASALGGLEVRGSASGTHQGRLLPHSDHEGVSFLPDTPFAPGETVTVRTSLPVAGASGGGFRFDVARPAAVSPAAPVLAEERAAAALRQDAGAAPSSTAGAATAGPYRSRPDLRPPVVTVRSSGPHAPGLTFASSGAATPTADAGVLMYDDAGQPVWFHALPNLGLGTLQRIRYRGQDALTWFTGTQAFRGGYKGTWVVADSSYRQIGEIAAANGLVADGHELRISPDGTRALLCIYNPIQKDMSAYGGSANATLYEAVVQELDLATGAVTFEWHSLDESPISDSLYTLQGPDVDYFHLNAMDYDTDGGILVSGRHVSQDLKLDPREAPGHRVVWRLGGKRSTYAFPNAADAPSYPHDVRRRPDGTISLYDNAVLSTRSGRGVDYRLDDRTRTATAVRTWPHQPPAYGEYVGSNRLLANGDDLVSYGNSGTATEYDPAGRPVWESTMSGGSFSYRTLRVDGWHAQPAEPPALASSRSGSAVTAWASWNGATDVASWVLLAGPDAGRLRPVGPVTRRTGFETTLTGSVTPQDTVVVAEARDAAGHLLRRSTGSDTSTAISAHYNSLGGADSLLGAPTAPERPVAGGAAQTYQRGVIFWSPATGAWEVHGAVLGTWAAWGAQTGVLGFPIADEGGLPDGVGRFSLFERGSVYWTPGTGAHEVHGAISGTWSGLGAQSGVLGYPVTDELVLADAGGRGEVFQGGAVFWTVLTGAHEVHGAIGARYADLGRERGVLGYPTRNEAPTGNGTGRYGDFQRGLILWSPGTGAHEVHGAIRVTWASLGSEAGVLGYPVSDEHDVPGGRRSDFQHGAVLWSAATGQITVLRY